ncbi:hypothetical protein CAPTEDRAFT_224540 [Capitella teleta]|uniref:MARVEL domain-containing protein n=1 Tax=Capitella teleta TaxID=283909 RepID=R7TSQ5_CAPTE|nr:hypothetical protein CAPTEDRAFT_224540 [Capitella teleta]|eukprot:ELT96918.1 hypothetical protein CAPTEDRAFT_224540 [Capitella teleta]
MAQAQTNATSYHTNGPNTLSDFASSHAKALGIVQIILGLLSMIFFIPGLVSLFGIYWIGYGIWCGLFYIIAGGLTIGAAKDKNKCLIIASLILCIVATLAAATEVGVGGFSVAWAVAEGEWYHRDDNGGVSLAGRMAINAVLAIIGLTAMVICIIASVLSCKVLWHAGQIQSDVHGELVALEDGRVVNAVVLGTPNQKSAETCLPPACEVKEKYGN